MRREVTGNYLSPARERGEQSGAQDGAARAAGILKVLIIDDQDAFVVSLERTLRSADIDVRRVDSLRAAAVALTAEEPDFIITEQRVAGEFLLHSLPELTASVPLQRIVILTSYPSIAWAVRFTRMGVAGYVAKPAPFGVLLDLLRVREQDVALEEHALWPSLARMTWEYLSLVHTWSGSLSGAARRLGLAPRSLRRMLAKFPPPR